MLNRKQAPIRHCLLNRSIESSGVLFSVLECLKADRGALVRKFRSPPVHLRRQNRIEIGKSRIHTTLAEQNIGLLNRDVVNRGHAIRISEQLCSEVRVVPNDLRIAEGGLHRLFERQVPDLILAGMSDPARGLRRGDALRALLVVG